MGFLTGLEAVNYNVNSDFSKELIWMFQEVIDYRKKIKENETTVSKIVMAVEAFFFKVTVPKLASCIEKHTGVAVGKLYLSKTFSAMFACTVDFDGDKGINMYTTIQRYSGLELSEFEQEYIKNHKYKPLSRDELNRLTDSFNKRTGKMDVSKLKGRNIKFILYFDYNAAFLVQETAHVKCVPLEAEEIAAIVMHEVGHMLTMFEHAAEAYFQAAFCTNTMLNTFLKNENKFVIIDYGLRYLGERFPNKKDVIDALKMKVDTIQKAFDGKQSESLPVFISLLYIALSTIFTLLFSTIILPFRLLGGIIMPMFDSIENVKKLSDYADLKKQFKYCEQLADEYVSRHGLSSGLAGGLRKMFCWFEITGLGTVNHNSSLVWNASKIPFIIMSLFYGDLTGGGGLYDREYDRITRAMTNLIGVFKNSDLPKEAIDFYIQDYEAFKNILADYNNHRRLTEITNTLMKLVDYILKTPVDLIFTGRFLDEYNKLSDKAETLTANSMFYHAAKLKLLSKKLNDVKEKK